MIEKSKLELGQKIYFFTLKKQKRQSRQVKKLPTRIIKSGKIHSILNKDTIIIRRGQAFFNRNISDISFFPNGRELKQKIEE